MEPKYPHVTVVLSGVDGNAYAILAVVQRGLQQHVGEEAAAQYYAEATSGDYDHLLRTSLAWVTVE